MTTATPIDEIDDFPGGVAARLQDQAEHGVRPLPLTALKAVVRRFAQTYYQGNPDDSDGWRWVTDRAAGTLSCGPVTYRQGEFQLTGAEVELTRWIYSATLEFGDPDLYGVAGHDIAMLLFESPTIVDDRQPGELPLSRHLEPIGYAWPLTVDMDR